MKYYSFPIFPSKSFKNFSSNLLPLILLWSCSPSPRARGRALGTALSCNSHRQRATSSSQHPPGKRWAARSPPAGTPPRFSQGGRPVLRCSLCPSLSPVSLSRSLGSRRQLGPSPSLFHVPEHRVTDGSSALGVVEVQVLAPARTVRGKVGVRLTSRLAVTTQSQESGLTVTQAMCRATVLAACELL